MSKSIQSGVDAFDDPTPGFLARFFGLDFFATGANVGGLTQGSQRLAHLLRIVASIQAQALCVTGSMRLANGFGRWRNSGQGILHQLHVVPVKAPSSTRSTGMPHASVSKLRLTRPLARSVGLGSVISPRNGALCSEPSRDMQEKFSPINLS